MFSKYCVNRNVQFMNFVKIFFYDNLKDFVLIIFLCKK